MVPGVIEHLRPLGGEAEADRLTTPVNPLTGATVIDELPAVPAVTVIAFFAAVRV